MKIRNWVTGVAIGVFALIGLAVVTLTLLIDPNRFRGQIEHVIQDLTGQPFAIRGDLEITWFPWLAVRTGAAQLGSPPLAQWRSARVGVRLVPLIRGRMVIDRIRFEGLRVNLKRAADGRGNWEALLAGSGSKSRGDRPPPRIGGVEIRAGQLDYVDEQAGTHYRLSDWDLDVGEWNDRATVPVSTTLTLENLPGDAKASFGASLELETRIHLGAKLDRLEARETELSGRARGAGLPAQGVAFATDWPQLSVTFAPLALSAPQWRIKVLDAQLSGSLTAETAAGRLCARGPLTLRIPSIREFLGDLAIDAPLPRDDTALGPLTFDTSWAFVGGALALKPVTLKIDDTSLKGELVRSSGAAPTWTFDLRGDRIDLRRYLITEDTGDEPFELPVEALRALRAQGTLAFDQARFDDARMKNARVRVFMADGRMRAERPGTSSGGAP